MIILGLGNPGIEYIETRHNAVFLFFDMLKDKNKAKESHISTYTSFSVNIGGEDVLCVKPQTFMNLSGRAVWELSRRREIKPEDILVVYDDVGKIRLRPSGSHGGHNGMRSVINAFSGDTGIPRLRIGVLGTGSYGDLKDYVLSDFEDKEFELLYKTFQNAEKAVEALITGGMEKAMGEFNGLSVT